MQIERINISTDVGFTVYKLGKDRPCITFISGISDEDGCGIVLLRKLIDTLKNKTLHGSIIVVPQINELNLKRSSCKKFDTSSVFCNIVEKLCQVLPKECFVVEVRCKKDFVEHIVVSQEFEKDDVKSLVESIPLEYIVKAKIKGVAGILRDKGFNVVSIIFNGGKEFNLDYVEQALGTMITMLSNLGISKKKTKQVQHKYFEGYYVVRCVSRGVFIPSIPRGVEIDVKTSIGTLNESGIFSKQSGLVLHISNPKLCDVDEVVAIIAVKKVSGEVTPQ